MMILRSSPPSPFGRKVRIALHHLGLAERVEIVATDTASETDTRTTTSNRVLRGRCRVTTARLPSRRAHQDALQDLELLQTLPGAEHDRL